MLQIAVVADVPLVLTQLTLWCSKATGDQVGIASPAAVVRTLHICCRCVLRTCRVAVPMRVAYALQMTTLWSCNALPLLLSNFISSGVTAESDAKLSVLLTAMLGHGVSSDAAAAVIESAAATAATSVRAATHSFGEVRSDASAKRCVSRRCRVCRWDGVQCAVCVCVSCSLYPVWRQCPHC